MKKLLLLSFFFLSLGLFAQLTPVASFGTNPGNLNMYTYVPSGIIGSAPLVVVMHGCTQNAQQAADQTGWNKLADLHKFYVMYPEQKAANNAQTCFNWFEIGDQERDQGEDLSIKQMVDHMKANYLVDNSQVFVTGLSAGAAMTSILCATYPEIFKGGAILAGGPYKSATNVFEASAAMSGTVTKTPAQWAALVTAQNPTYMGSYPRIAIFHGSNDAVVHSNNAMELMKQWTAVHGTDQTEEASIGPYAGNSFVIFKSYRNLSMQEEVVRWYTLSMFGHALPIDTGSCPQQGGQIATYAIDNNFHSTWHAAHFFGLIDTTSTTIQISGPTGVAAMQSNVVYTTNQPGGANYFWSVPTGATNTTGQGNNTISVNFGSNPGLVTVMRLSSNLCVNGPESIWVDLCTCSGIEDQSNNASVSIAALDNKVLQIKCSKGEFESVKVFDLLGNEIFKQYTSAESVSLQLPESVKEGVYIVQVSGNSILLNKKIIIR